MLLPCASAALGLALVAHLACAHTLPAWNRQPQPEPLLRPPTFGDDDAPAADPRVTLCTLVSVRPSAGEGALAPHLFGRAGMLSPSLHQTPVGDRNQFTIAKPGGSLSGPIAACIRRCLMFTLDLM